jgi:hypothetical protein
VTLSREAIQTYEALRAQALVGQGAGTGWWLLVRYGVWQGLSRCQHSCAQAPSIALANDATSSNAAIPSCSHLLPTQLIHAMATMVANLMPKEPFHGH